MFRKVQAIAVSITCVFMLRSVCTANRNRTEHARDRLSADRAAQLEALPGWT